MSILIPVVSCILILLSAFMILVILAQKAKSDGGMGSAMGGGVAEAAFGAETGNVLTKATINSAIAFFVLTFLLYLGQVYQHKHAVAAGGTLPTILAPTPTPTPTPGPTTIPAAPTGAAPTPTPSIVPPAPSVQPVPQPAPSAATTTVPAEPAKKP